MSEYDFKYTLLKRRRPFLDFLKMVGDLNVHLRSWWAWIKGFLNALSELLLRAEKFVWNFLFKNLSSWFSLMIPTFLSLL